MSQYSNMIKRVAEEPEQPTGAVSSGLRRAGTVVRAPLESRKEKDKGPNGTMRPSEVRGILLICTSLSLNSQLGSKYCLGPNCPTSFPRGRVHRRLPANKRCSLNLCRLHWIGPLLP